MQRIIEAAQARKLDRVAAVYSVAGWILVQGASILLPTFDAPLWALRVFIIVVLIGFPVALAVAWTMATHPHPAEGAAPAGFRRADIVLLAALGIVIALSAVQFAFAFRHQEMVPPLPATASAAPAQASIAVLAFNNMSDDPKNEYFSDGISEELLNDLAQVTGLRVAGRTSSFSFKGTSATIEDIGKALGVRTVLEGSVQREGDRVRITAQLIDATNDFHLWSQSYDREISDIFVVEDEISRAITQELTRRLLPDTASDNTTPAKPKINPAAYTAYLQGIFFWNKRNKDDMERAADFFKQAIALEPDYAAAHAGLASVYCVLFLNGQRRDIIQEAKDETAAALRLDPNNSWALLNEAGLGLASWNWMKADTDLRRVLERNPNNADAEHVYAYFLLDLDIPEAALAWDRRAGALDPLAPLYRSDAGLDLHALGRDEEAIAEFRTALTLDPNYAFALGGICASYADTGKLNDATQVLRGRLLAVDGEDGPNTLGCEVAIARRENDTPQLKRLAKISERLYAGSGVTASEVAYPYAFAGDFDAAIRWLEKAYNDRDSLLLGWLPGRDLPVAFKADPRWQAFMQRPLLKSWQAAHDRIAAKLAAHRDPLSLP
jgi:adenylate cyclase